MNKDLPEEQPLRTIRIVAGQGSPSRRPRFLLIAVITTGILLGVITGAVAMVTTPGSQPGASRPPQPGAADSAAELRLGYFGNVTHALPVVGVAQGRYQRALGDTVLRTQVFNAGPSAIEALNAGAIDAAYLGPNPAINSYVKSGGTSLRIVAGAASGGAQLVVRPDITEPAQLRGAVLATPQLGGTQDVALRTWLADQGLDSVTINPTENAQTLRLFQSGAIDGAWVPEPWASRLVLEAGAAVLVDERELWPQGRFPTTVLVVSQKYLTSYPQTVQALLAGQRETQAWLSGQLSQAPEVALQAINDGLVQAAGADLPEATLRRALQGLSFEPDPLASSYPQLLANGVAAGVTQNADLRGIFDLRLLNEVLQQPALGPGVPVSSAGLGQE